MNTFGYATNNPLIYYDRDGLSVLTAPLTISSRVITIIGPPLLIYCSLWPQNCAAVIGSIGNIPDDPVYPDDFPILDPLNETNTETRVPSNTLPPDFCESDYQNCLDKCESRCTTSFSRTRCRLKCAIKKLLCDRRGPPGGDNDGPGGEG